MRSVYVFLVFLIFLCTGWTPAEKKLGEPNYFNHLKFLLSLKNEVAKTSWPAFAEKDFFQPVVYYTTEGTYVLNPNEHILNNFEHIKADPFKDIDVIKLAEQYTDTTNFRFYTSYSDNDSTALSYKENVLFFQSFDLTRKFIPEINDLRDWSIMVIHEFFHGYQRSIPEHRAYYQNIEIPGGPDKFLGAKYHDLPWYKESVFKENELLKAIWIEGADPATNLVRYDSLRSARIERVQQEFEVDIRAAEDYEILTEGHARYFESLCKRYLARNLAPVDMLKEKDLEYITELFKNYEITKDKALYDLYNDRYYYQLGYDISMILEKYLPAYKDSLYVSENNFNPFLEKLVLSNR